MRHIIIAAATLGVAFITTAASAAIIPPRHHRYIPQVSCEASLGMLRTVRSDEVMDVSFDNTIVIRPVCTESRVDGNASGLRGIIGRNDAMAAALDAESFRADDVVGIQFGADGLVLLYVAQ